MCYLRRSFFFPLTLRYARPLLRISHSLYIGKTSHTTIKLVSLIPSTIGKFLVSWGFSLGMDLCFDIWKISWLQSGFALFFFLIETYLFLENYIWLHKSNYILGSNSVDFENDGFMLDSQLSKVSSVRASFYRYMLIYTLLWLF